METAKRDGMFSGILKLRKNGNRIGLDRLICRQNSGLLRYKHKNLEDETRDKLRKASDQN